MVEDHNLRTLYRMDCGGFVFPLLTDRPAFLPVDNSARSSQQTNSERASFQKQKDIGNVITADYQQFLGKFNVPGMSTDIQMS